MTIEQQIIDAVNATGFFKKVRYIIAESSQDAAAIEKPFFILSGKTRDDTIARTFCGSALSNFTYDAIIGAESSVDLDAYVNAAISAVAGIVNVTSTVDDYDEQGAFYFSTLTLSVF